MDGKLYGIALGPDLDGLTGSELENEIDMLSDDEEDGINVTIREVTKPKPNASESTPKMKSVLVVPSASKSTLLDWMPKSTPTESSTPAKMLSLHVIEGNGGDRS